MTEDKFREIYHQYYQLVMKVIYNVLHDVDLSEDVCQEVFLLFIEKQHEVEEMYYRQWFAVNAKRKAIDFCRRAYQVHEVTAMETAEDENSSESDRRWSSCGNNQSRGFEEEFIHKIILRDLTEKLFEELAKKNFDWYEIVMRMFVEGESAEETARALGISIGSLRAKRHRIKMWFNKHYRDVYESI